VTVNTSQLTNIASRARASNGLIYSSSLLALKVLVGNSNIRQPARCAIITHLLPTAIEYIEEINGVIPVEVIVGIPYSADELPISVLKEKGYEVIIPETVKDTFELAQQATLAALENNTVPLIVQEVGGYLSSITKKLSSYKHFLGIVEDTNNGHWLYEETSPHQVPILSIAQSPLKQIEDSVIGDAVIYSIEKVLREKFYAMLQGARTGVIGFGNIGTSCAIALKGRESTVSVYDINPEKNMRAKMGGFFPLPLDSLLATSEVIIGATGRTSITAKDMDNIKDGAILVSASSKDVEFTIHDFRKLCMVEEVNDATDRFVAPSGKHFFLLNKGFPINFRDKSIIGTLVDMIYSELFLCMKEVIEGKIQPDIHHSGEHIQLEVSKYWMRSHSEIFRTATSDKMWNFDGRFG
jgi:adenosylhomocysteinase